MTLSFKNTKDIADPWTVWFLYGPTGCITGDAMIGINRAGKGAQVKLSHVVKMFNGGVASGKRWDTRIPTKVRARLDDGSIGLVTLRDAYASGVKPVYRLTLATGHEVVATADHRFLTPDGWRRLHELTVGDVVFVEMSRHPVSSQEQQDKPWYHLTVARFHPYVGRKGVKTSKGGNTVATHRLVVDAYRNGIPFDEFVQRCSQRGALHGLKFVDPKKYAVHHKDENPRNINISNLEVLTHTAHRKLHAAAARKNIAVLSTPSVVQAIKAVGSLPTFDLALDAPHNFLANGIVVHNSGKTTSAATFPDPMFLVPKIENSQLTLKGLDFPFIEITDLDSPLVDGRGGMNKVMDELRTLYNKDPNEFPYQTIVIESVSHYSDLVVEALTNGGKNAMDQLRWGLFTSHFRHLHTMLRDMQVHVVYTALATIEEKGNTAVGGPLLSGASKVKLPAACDVIGYCEAITGKNVQQYKIHFQNKPPYEARTRFKKLPGVVENFNFAEIEQYLR